MRFLKNWLLSAPFLTLTTPLTLRTLLKVTFTLFFVSVLSTIAVGLRFLLVIRDFGDPEDFYDYQFGPQQDAGAGSTEERLMYVTDSDLIVLDNADNTTSLESLVSEEDVIYSTVPSVEQIFEKRRLQLQAACARLRDSNSNPSPFYSYTLGSSNKKNWVTFSYTATQSNQRLTIDYCPVFKSGSSSWLAMFTYLSGGLTPRTESLIRKGKMNFVKLVRDLRMTIRPPSPKNAKAKKNANGNSTSYKMLVVRHPFERLLSAYRDKLERVKGREFYQKKYGYKIVEKYRRRKSSRDQEEEETREQGLELHALIKHILDKQTRRSGQFSSLSTHDTEISGGLPTTHATSVVSISPQLPPRLGYGYTPPTFSEFVNFVLDSPPTAMDEHWRPIYADCQPCTHSFDFILHVETMNTDKDYLLSVAGLNSNSSSNQMLLDGVWRRWTHKSITDAGVDASASGAMDKDKETILRAYFAQLNRNQLARLEELYRLDLELFGYSSEEYENMVRASA